MKIIINKILLFKNVYANISILLVILCALLFQYYTFRAGNIGVDHALMDNIFRNILDGNGVTSHGTLSFIRNDINGDMLQISNPDNNFVTHFAVHFDPMLYLFAPFRALFGWMQSGQLLATTLWVFISTLPAVALIKKIEGNGITAKYIVSVVFALPIGFGMLTNVPHPIILAIPFMISAVYFAYVEKWIWYWFFLIGAFLFQESIPLFMISITFMIWSRNKKIALATGIVCISYFIISMAAIKHIVAFNNVSLDRLGWDAIAFGDSVNFYGSVVKYILFKFFDNPLIFVSNVFNLKNIEYIILASIVSGNIFLIRGWSSVLVILFAAHNQLLMSVTSDMGRGSILYEFHWHYSVYFLIAFFINYAIKSDRKKFLNP
jgi:hypothetical protein